MNVMEEIFEIRSCI